VSQQLSAGRQLFAQLADLIATPGADHTAALVILEPSGKEASGAEAGTPAADEALSDLVNTIPAAATTFFDSGGTYDDVWEFVLKSAAPSGPSGDPVRVTLANLISDNRADFELMARARLGAPGDVYHPVAAEPPDWLGEDGWTSASFRVGGEDPDPAPVPEPGIVAPEEPPDPQWRLLEPVADTQPEALWQSPESQPVGLEPNEVELSARDVDVLGKVAPLTTAASGFEMNFEYRIVGLKRPWLRAHLCELSGWTIPGLPTNGLSNGEPAGNRGLLPVITTRMLVVRNLVVKSKWSEADRDRVASAKSLALGPFALTGAESFDGFELTRPAPQVVAWLANVVPACPKAGAPSGTEFLGRGTVVSKKALSVRSEPTTHSATVAELAPGQSVTIACKTRGEIVDGNKIWYKLGQEPRGWVAARYVNNLGPIPFCSG
jgi:hypothetical protein